MKKLSYIEKEEIYKKVKEKVSVTHISSTYNISRKNIYYMVQLVDKHGLNILKPQKPLHKIRLRNGKFSDELLSLLYQAAKWIEDNKKVSQLLLCNRACIIDIVKKRHHSSNSCVELHSLDILCYLLYGLMH